MVDASVIRRRLEAFKARASEAGVKLTHQRLEIFREVAASLEHPDAETLLKAVRPTMPTVSLDTVYRTLWLLNDLGLVITLSPRRQSVRFDANLESHHHYVCERCGLVRDFNSAELDEIRVPAAVRAFGTIIRAQVEVRGICERCARKTGRHSPPPSRKQQQRRLRKALECTPKVRQGIKGPNTLNGERYGFGPTSLQPRPEGGGDARD